MPEISGAALTTWRTHPQSMQVYAAFIRPSVVLERRVNMGSFTYPLAELTYDDPDGGAGVYTAVKAHMTLEVLSAAGVRKGFLRIRKSPTASKLYVSEVSAGDVDFADNDRLVVYDDYRLWARIPRLIPGTKTFAKDYDVTYTDQGSQSPPVANAGPAFAGLADPGTGTADVDFDGTASFKTASNLSSPAVLSYFWNFVDGTPSSSTAAQPSAAFAPGQRWVELYVTDLNGKTHRAVAPVIVCDDVTNPPVPVVLERLSGSVEGGWDCAVRVAAGDVSDLLPGTFMVLFTEQQYGSSSGVINGYAGREHVIFAGWLSDDDVTVEPFQDDVVLNARSALGKMQEIAAFSSTLEHRASPSKWHHMQLPNAFRLLMHLLEWHTTATLVCDIERPPFDGEYYFPAGDATGGTIYDQLAGVAPLAWSRLTCDKNGRLYVRRNPHTMTASERAALATTVHLLSTDWRDGVRIQRRAARPSYWLRGGGFTSSSSAPALKLALAPGDSPGQGPILSERNGNWIADQTELNVRLGHAYALDNTATPLFQLTLNHQGLPFDPAWGEVVEVTLDPASNKRGIGFTQAPFIIRTFDVAHDPERGVTTETLTLEEWVEGAPATTQPVPDGETEGGGGWIDETWIPPDIEIDPYEPPAPPTNVPTGLEIVYAADTQYLKRTRNFVDTTPAWTTVFNALTDVGSGWAIRDAQPDNYDPKNTLIVIVSGPTTTRAYRTTNLDDDPPTWTQVREWSHITRRCILLGSLLPDTWFLFTQEATGGGAGHLSKTDDNFATETYTANINNTGSNCGFFISNHMASYTSGLAAVGYDNRWIAQSSDYGGTFIQNTGTAFPGGVREPHDILIPYQGNEDEQTFYVLGGADASVEAYLYKTINGGTSFQNIAPTGITYPYPYGGGEANRYQSRRYLYDWTQDSDKLTLLGAICPDKHGFVAQAVFASDDAGANWTLQYDLPGPWVGYSIGGWPYDSDILFMNCNDRLLYSDDRGATWSQKQWSGYSGGIWTIPVWLA